MKHPIYFLCCLIVISFLLSESCTSEPVTVASSSDGIPIKFDVEGKGNPALVLVHGWGNNRSIWNAQVEHFSKKYKTVAVDLPGFGESGNNRDSWTVSAFGGDIVSVANALDLEDIVLVGFSMGGPVVVEAAKPLSDRVTGLVLVDVMQNVEFQFPPEMIAFTDSVFMDLVTAPSLEKMGPFFRKNPDEAYQRVLDMMNDGRDKGTDGIPKGWREAFQDIFRWANEDCIASLKAMQCPVIAINSDQEPTNVEGFKKHVPEFEAKIIPGTGHVVMWDATEEFNRLLEESIQEFVSKGE